jgi:hypothetical protein
MAAAVTGTGSSGLPTLPIMLAMGEPSGDALVPAFN